MGCSKGRAHLSLFAKRGSSTLIHVLHASQRKKQNASYWEGRLPGARGGCCWWLAWLRRRPCCSQCCCCWSRWLLHKLLKPGLPLLRRVLRIRRLYMWDEWNVFYVGTRAFYEHIQKLQCCSSFLRRSGTTRCHSASRTYQALINPPMPFCKRKPLFSIRQLKKKAMDKQLHNRPDPWRKRKYWH